MTRNLVLMFPGQSSRYPEMLEKLSQREPACAERVSQASEILGRDLLAHYRSDNTGIFARNRDVQVGVFLANQLHLELLQRAGVDAAWSLGLSLGEYNHLVHIGALSFEDALRIVDRRGQLYDRAQGGAMVSIFPIDVASLESVIAELGVAERVVVGLNNSPRQQVLSGRREDVERVVAAVEAETYVETVVLETRIAMHSPLLADLAVELGRDLRAAAWRRPRLPYVPNTRALLLYAPQPNEICACLTEHVQRRVHWQASIEALASHVSAPLFVEVGPRAVLFNLFGRGWSPGRRACTDVGESWSAHFAALRQELRRGS